MRSLLQYKHRIVWERTVRCDRSLSERRFVMVEMDKIVSEKRCWVSLFQPNLPAIALSFGEAIAKEYDHHFVMVEIDKIVSRKRCWGALT